MTSRYLLDTNIVSALVKDPHGPIASHITRVGVDHVATSVIVACELRFGVAKKNAARGVRERVEALLGTMTVLPFEHDADLHYGALRAALEARGRLIGANDLLIAAHALALDAVLVTDNVNEFKRVSGLSVRNWLR